MKRRKVRSLLSRGSGQVVGRSRRPGGARQAEGAHRGGLGTPRAARGAAPASPRPSRRGLEPRPRVQRTREGALTRGSVPDQTACRGRRGATHRAFRDDSAHGPRRRQRGARPPCAEARPPPEPAAAPSLHRVRKVMHRAGEESGGCREYASAPACDTRKQSCTARLALHPADGRTTLHLVSAGREMAPRAQSLETHVPSDLRVGAMRILQLFIPNHPLIF